MVDVSSLFELLAAGHRRDILFRLCWSESVQVPDDVVPQGKPPTPDSPGRIPGQSPFPGTHPQPLAVELHHRHLPKLVDAGLIEWDREAGTVTRGPTFATVEPVLRLLADNTDLFPDESRCPE